MTLLANIIAEDMSFEAMTKSLLATPMDLMGKNHGKTSGYALPANIPGSM